MGVYCCIEFFFFKNYLYSVNFLEIRINCFLKIYMSDVIYLKIVNI